MGEQQWSTNAHGRKTLSKALLSGNGSEGCLFIKQSVWTIELYVMHLFYTSCIIYEHRAVIYPERVKKVVRALVSIQRSVHSEWCQYREEKLIKRFNDKLHNKQKNKWKYTSSYVVIILTSHQQVKSVFDTLAGTMTKREHNPRIVQVNRVEKAADWKNRAIWVTFFFTAAANWETIVLSGITVFQCYSTARWNEQQSQWGDQESRKRV